MPQGTCSVDGCDHEGFVTGGMCIKHYNRVRKHGNPETVHPGGIAVDIFATEKRCNGCERVLAIEKFGRTTATRSGRRARCKECRATAERLSAGVRTPRSAPAKDSWRTKNRDRYLAWQRDYNQRTKERQRASKRKHTFLKRLDKDRDALAYAYILRRDPCAYCGEPATEVDHIQPKGIGPRGDLMNLTSACGYCNRSKRQMSLLAFLLKRGERVDGRD